MKTLLTALIFAATLTAAWAQSIGLATDTNGNIVSRRTNTLTFTNPLTWTANVVAATRTNLGLGTLATNNSVPSGAAASGSALTADGSGGSSFVASRFAYFGRTNSLSRSNFNTGIGFHPNYNDDQLVNLPLDASSVYLVSYTINYETTVAAGFGASLAFTGLLPNKTFRSGSGQQHNAAWQSLAFTSGTNGTANQPVQTAVTNAGTNVYIAGLLRVQTDSLGGTVTLRWMAGASNSDPVTVNTGTTITLQKLYP